MPDTSATGLQRSAFLISDMAADRTQQRLAAATLGLLVIASAAVAPFAAVQLPGTEAALSAYAAALLMVELVTAAMLMALFAACRRRAILALAAGYLFCGLLVVPWALTFPGVFAPEGLLQAGLQTTAVISAVRRLAFPLCIIIYATCPRGEPDVPRRHLRPFMTATIAAAAVSVAGLVWLSVSVPRALPPFMNDAAQAAPLWIYVPSASAALIVIAGALLWPRRRIVLDLWLLVVLATLLIEITLMSFLSAGRLSLGWWAGRIYGLSSSSTVLIVLLASMTTIYARLLQSISLESRHRAARLATMEALAASIAHELNQPLASAVTNANAAQRWLNRPNPDLDEARAALQRIADDGLRGGQVIESIRALFARHGRERVPLDINALVAAVIERNRADAELQEVTIRTELGAHLPPVTGNAVQLQQVLGNLMANACEAMAPVTGRPKVMTVRSSRGSDHQVLVSVSDTGIGLDPAERERVLEPFFSTKPHGMGMGLTICTSILESHGGRIWATDRMPNGAVFQFSVPAALEDA